MIKRYDQKREEAFRQHKAVSKILRDGAKGVEKYVKQRQQELDRTKKEISK